MRNVRSALILASLCAAFPVKADSGQKHYFLSGLYCAPLGKALDVFAARVVKGGDLKFGISRWKADGQGFLMAGLARPYRSGWRYREEKSQTDSGCSVEININRRGDVSVMVNKSLSCDGYAGHGFSEKSFVIANKFRKGPESGLLNNDNFFNEGVCN